jgi:endonuclease/exonuclease/phosphatase family metal-dependent hydrolase
MQLQGELSNDDALIVAGDFNDWRGTAGEVFERLVGVQEAFHSQRGVHARSFPAVFPLLSLDRVYFKNLFVTESHALSGLPWSRFSDHIPLVVDFEFV